MDYLVVLLLMKFGFMLFVHSMTKLENENRDKRHDDNEKEQERPRLKR